MSSTRETQNSRTRLGNARLLRACRIPTSSFPTVCVWVCLADWLAGCVCLCLRQCLCLCVYVWSVSVPACLRDDILYLRCCIVHTNGQCACRRGLRNDGSATRLQMMRLQRLRGGSVPEDDGLLVPSTLPLFLSLARSLARFRSRSLAL
jgi:hypothetical protein